MTYGKVGINFFKCLSGRTSRDSEVVEGLLSKGAFADWCTQRSGRKGQNERENLGGEAHDDNGER